MNFAPKTEKQLVEERLIPAGNYPFEVIGAEAKPSKAGNEMIEMEVRLFMPDGSSRGLKDWLTEKMAFKLFHFCAYTGLSQKYEAGTLTSHDCVGRTGYAKIVIQADKQGVYPDRNSIADYVRSLDSKMGAGGLAPIGKPAPTDAQLANQSDNPPDDVPF